MTAMLRSLRDHLTRLAAPETRDERRLAIWLELTHH